jgi:predicted double-glycine peptidase
VRSLKERKFAATARQQYDFSCGSAALATLLSFHYEDPVGEAEVFEAMYARGDREKIRREGFSLLDMKEYLESRGYRADGYRVPVARLAAVGVPAISLVNERGYKHFVVVKGVRSDGVLVGDPFRGTRVLSRREYDELSGGLLFVIRNRSEVGRRHFNDAGEWRAARPAGVGRDSLPIRGGADVALHLPGAHEF